MLVHFLRNILSCIPKEDSKSFREQANAIFRLTSIDAARVAKNLLVDACE